MSKDFKCPYCERWQEVCHDDGFGYAEDEFHEMECSGCGKSLVFTTTITYDYVATKADCLNGGEHKYKAVTIYPVKYSKMRCTECGLVRLPTDQERKEIEESVK